MTEPCFGHDSGTFIIKRLHQKYIQNQELGNLNRFPVKGLLMQGLLGFRYWKSQQSVAFQE
jgi:hypothetical protein